MTDAALFAAATELLEAGRGLLAEDAPGRSYVSVGEPPWDCEQLVVWASDLSIAGSPDYPSGIPAPRFAPVIFAATYSVEVLWCAPNVGKGAELPPAAALATAAEASYLLAWRLYGGLSAMAMDEAAPLLGAYSFETQVRELAPKPAQGGFEGWGVTVVALLNDGPVGG